MTPMNLERALEVAIEACESVKMQDSDELGRLEMHAAATLRAFLEAHKAATAFVEERQPQVTEALARLKALEERLRLGCSPDNHQTVLALQEDFSGYIPHGCSCSMADEIAAIRTKLEGK